MKSCFSFAAALLLIFISAAPATGAPKRAPKEYGTPEEMLQAAPAEGMPQPGGKWTELQMEATNAKLKEIVVGQKASLAFKVAAVEKAKNGLRMVRADHSQLRGTTVVRHAFFTEDNVALLAKIKVDETLRVNGVISRCYLVKENGKILFKIELSECSLPNK